MKKVKYYLECVDRDVIFYLRTCVIDRKETLESWDCDSKNSLEFYKIQTWAEDFNGLDIICKIAKIEPE
jgi:hypothetical protein